MTSAIPPYFHAKHGAHGATHSHSQLVTYLDGPLGITFEGTLYSVFSVQGSVVKLAVTNIQHPVSNVQLYFKIEQ